ncbi:MAG: glycogen debranching N-terminal domain-containing protein [Ornithinibacter sp.]
MTTAADTEVDPSPDAARSRQPWLHRLQTAVRGNATCLSLASGDIQAGEGEGAASGLYVDDRRVLDHLVLTVDDVKPEPVAADSQGRRSVFLSIARNAGDSGADPTVHVHRRLSLVVGGLDVQVEIHSRSMAPVRCVVRLELSGDGAEVHEVKAGAPAGPALPVSFAADGRARWGDARHETVVEASGAHISIDAGRVVARWDLELEAGGRRRLDTSVRATRTSSTPFDAGCGAAGVHWGSVRVQAQDSRLSRTIDRSLSDLRHLLLSDPEDERDVFAAAGSPWYLTLFGRDSIWAARMCLPFGNELAGGTLRALARRQGQAEDRDRAEQPGKILHEVRRTTFEDPGHLHLPPLYYGTVDATPLWVNLLHDAWRWGLADPEIVALAGPLEAALGWLRRSVEDSDDGLLRYVDETGVGLSNQGWKDSGDSMRMATGAIAEGPIALLETQAYAVEAALGAADLLEAVHGKNGDPWREWGHALGDRVRAAFWVGDKDERYLAMALDGRGRAIDGVGSNMGHALGTGLLTAEEDDVVARRLAAPDLLGPLGIGTLSRHNPAYNPLGYHTGSVWTHDTAIGARGLAKVGHGSTAARVLRSLVDVAAASGYRWPELYSSEPVLDVPAPYPASCRPQAWAAASAGLVLTAALGLSADVPRGLVHLSPMREAPFGALTVEGLRVAGGALRVEVDAMGSVVDVEAPSGITVVCADTTP